MTMLIYAAAFIGFWFLIVPAVLNFFTPDPPWRRSKAAMDADYDRALEEARKNRGGH